MFLSAKNNKLKIYTTLFYFYLRLR